MIYQATYDPADNKLRLRASQRLDAETYGRAKKLGFIWAPKQELFVAPMWTPAREDFLLELAGKIGDEDTSLVERAEERAGRFDDYADHRERDAVRAEEAVHAISDGIPLGQPILVGHHSQRHAERDAKKIENGVRRAAAMWDASAYWLERAAGAIAHAKYKERPAVRARRIKGLEADRRREERAINEAEKYIKLWDKTPEITRELALRITNCDHISVRVDGRPEWYSLHDAITDNQIAPENARERAITAHNCVIENANRWIAHIDNRLAYERAMLAESGYTPPPKKPSRAALPILNYPAMTIAYRNIYRDEMIEVPVVSMTKAEYAEIHDDYKCTRIVGGSHRYRVAMKLHKTVGVFLSDSKVHAKPEAVQP